MKRAYTLVSHKKTDDGQVIQLDGKAVKTHLKQDLAAPTKALADAIVAEWAAQGETVIPDTMPLTQILTTAIDRMRERDAITNTLTGYLDTDLLCYRVREPEILAKRQAEIWGGWIAWFDEHFESALKTTFDLQTIKQDYGIHRRIWNYIEALDEYYFAVLNIAASTTGSIVLALAFLQGDATPQQVFDAFYLEEDYHAELAGGGHAPQEEKKRAAIRHALEHLRRFVELVDSP